MALSADSVHERLRSAANRLRLSRAVRFLTAGLAVSFFFLCIFLLADSEFHFGAIGRWFAFALTVAPLLAGFALALPACWKKIPEASIARRIELASVGSGNVLINAVQFDRELLPGSSLRAALF